ncbi:flavin reductase family protein [Streptomyces sp. RB6PN25]|uniref:Flavin reductase family protein n=2 Tax=Streptomyces humicola TaxID=2953240 RepID=A0ABT1PTS9_9ACTN|nr:flavin reductase family protein [Streptomyces humicola]
MAAVPAPVTIATTIDRQGKRWGFTGSSFTSLSANPPMVMICLSKTASTHAAFTGCAQFMVNVLADNHGHIARRFAAPRIDRFSAGDMGDCEAGLPGLPDAVVRLVCALHQVLDGGDHSILVGRVEQAVTTGGEPLVYCGRTFTQLALESARV